MTVSQTLQPSRSVSRYLVFVMSLMVGGGVFWVAHTWEFAPSALRLTLLSVMQIVLIVLVLICGWIPPLRTFMLPLALALCGIGGLVISFLYPTAVIGVYLAWLAANTIILVLLSMGLVLRLAWANLTASAVLIGVVLFNLIVGFIGIDLPSLMERMVAVAALIALEVLLYNLVCTLSSNDSWRHGLQIGATALLLNLGLLFFSLA